MKPKFYAVRKGRSPGIYTSWEDCAAQVKGFPGAVYKGFETLADARAFLNGQSPRQSSAPPARQAAFIEFEASQPAAEPAKPASNLPPATLYTDGGCINNPGPGGYGVVLLANSRRQELSGGFRLTTNNRMELMACIMGLERIAIPSAVHIISDSRYLINAIQSGWVQRWKRMGWQRKEGPVPNADLWQRLLAALERHEVDFEWVRGHTGNPENERCDQLAMAAALKPNLPADPGYGKTAL